MPSKNLPNCGSDEFLLLILAVKLAFVECAIMPFSVHHLPYMVTSSLFSVYIVGRVGAGFEQC